jgi:retron-type reverse transcriptase
MWLYQFFRWLFGKQSSPRPPQAMTSAPRPGDRPFASQSGPPPLPTAAAPRRTPPQNKTLHLDAGQFAPVSAEEAKKQARGIKWNWASVNFDRRDHIPAPTEPRTLLIDRAMVAQGLLTPEQLVEIHDAGAKMAELRPDLAGAANVAEHAVAADQEERRRRKEQKIAESAERKRKHAEAVAHRRATDIIFLGRGVSGGLSDRRANVEKLQQLHLPVLATPADVAKALALEIPRLRWLAFHSEACAVSHYVRFTIPKKSGGTRELAAPHRDMARCQLWIKLNILDRLPLHEAAHGFVAHRGTMSNAVPHVRRDVVVNADLKNFFPTITFPRVKGIFQELGYSPAVATVLALLCTECPRQRVNYAGRDLHVATGPRALPQGACTSPALSNLAARGLDARLAGLARKLGWNYTRYADDLTFSTNGESAQKTAWVLARLRHIAQEENFTVNEAKTRVQRPNSQQTVTGIVVNKRPNVPRETLRRLRAILHHAKTEGLAAQNREQHSHFAAWVRGMIAYVQMVNPERGQKLKAEFDALPK